LVVPAFFPETNKSIVDTLSRFWHFVPAPRHCVVGEIEDKMTNIFKSPKKASTKNHLFNIAVEALQTAGWKVERVPGNGKSSVRRIVKGGVTKLVSIRTTQDTWIAFPRTEEDKGWRTLDDVDQVVAVSVDDRQTPKFAKVHILDGDEMRDRFNRAYAARKKAGHTIPIGRGVWVSLYLPEAQDPVSHIGAGAGLKYQAIATVPLIPELIAAVEATSVEHATESHAAEAPLSIAEAKRRLAGTLGVDPANIKITVEA
jgi:hypothetical protein